VPDQDIPRERRTQICHIRSGFLEQVLRSSEGPCAFPKFERPHEALFIVLTRGDFIDSIIPDSWGACSP